MPYDRFKTLPGKSYTFKHQWTDYAGNNTSSNLVRVNPNNTMSGENIPHFHSRRKQGELLPHTMFDQFEVKDSSFQGFNMTATKGATWYKFFDHVFHEPPKIWHAADTSGTSGLVTQAAGRVATQGFDAGTAVAELTQVVRMLKEAGLRLHTLIYDAEARSARALTAKEFHRLWLEGRYGWRLLAYDIKNLYEALSAFDSERKIWNERVGYSYTEKSTGNLTPVSAHPQYGTVRATWSATTRHSIRGACSAELTQEHMFVDVPLTAWELIPLSFVIDWAIGVADALSAFRLYRMASNVTASFGVASETTYVSTVNSIDPKATWVMTVNGGFASFTASRQTRTPTTVSLKPSLKSGIMNPLNVLDVQALYRAAHILRPRTMSRKFTARGYRVQRRDPYPYFERRKRWG